MEVIDISAIRIAYIFSICTAFIIGLIVYKYNKRLNILVGLIGLGVFTELFVEVNKYIKIDTENFFYNIYIPLEYFLYAFFFYKINEHRLLRKLILISIPLFIGIAIVATVFKETFSYYLATDIYTISGLLVIIWSIWTLFVLKPIKNIKFTMHPLFWICIGIIIFHSGIIPFNMTRDYIKEYNYELFDWLSKFYQKGFNIWLYTAFSIGFICSHRMKIYKKLY